MKKLFSSLSYVLVVVSFILVFVAMMLSMTISEGKVPSIFGYSALIVSSGSMEPKYPVKSVVISKQVSIEDLRVGDVITFYSNDPDIYNTPVTHRINEIKTDSDGDISLITKGDANLICDKYLVFEEDVIGKVIGCNNFFGRFIQLISNRWIFFSIIILPLFLVCVFSVKDIFKTVKHSKEVELVEEQDI